MIPQKLNPQTKSNAEKKLFEVFKSKLSDDYIVFHGPWWQDIKYIIQDREADFIIVHPKQGILILEAKGGTIEYEPFNMVWCQNGKQMKISPFQQAREIKFKFLNFLGKYPEFSKKDFCIGQCVAFPDMDERTNRLPSEASQEILMLRPQLDNISQWISSIFNYYKRGEKFLPELGEDRKNLIIDLISPSTKMTKFLANDIKEVNEEILTLTEQQFDILNTLCFQQQCIISGCAGSGKTQLAIEKTKRLCQHKIKVLVICKSEYLSQYIAICLKNEIEFGYCTVSSYQNLQEQDSAIIFEAIIVDEGQDFNLQEINELKKFIPDNGIFYIFQDSNQNLSKNLNNFVLEVHPYILDKNCRNTKQIFKYAEPFVACGYRVRSSSMDGIDVVTQIYNKLDDIYEILEKNIINLIEENKISPNQIVILTDIYPVSKSILSTYSHIKNYDLREYSFPNQNKNVIYWSNIRIYKGLESDIVILIFEKPKTLIPNIFDIANRYVGATRAKNALIVCETPDPEIDF